MPPKPAPGANRLVEAVEGPDEDDDDTFAAPTTVVREPVSKGASEPTVRARQSRQADVDKQGTATIYVSQGVATRLEEYRRKASGRTNLHVVLEAIQALHQELPGIIEESKVYTGPGGGLFPVDPRKVKYLGGGGVQVQFKPTPEQAEVLDDLGTKLGFRKRSTWIAPVLNRFLPGHKEKRSS